MKFKSFDWYCWFVTILVFGSFILFWFYTNVGYDLVPVSLCSLAGSGSCFVFDSVGFYLSLLSVFLLFSLLFFFESLSCRSLFYVTMSVFSALLCYCSNHVFLFWLFYEVSILSLLFLLVVESPYSERYLAGWYLAGYVVFTSLPMVLCLVYFTCLSGSLFMSDWMFLHLIDDLGVDILLFLGILFITKIPVPPFHTWLPIVHAEATSIVSVCLSGYIMKLGLLGVCRFCWYILPDYLFSSLYVSVSFFLSIVFFFMASWELDGKRWLAFLSLSHIIICIVCFNCCLFDSCSLLFLYSLGHGLSAGVVFIFLWLGYNLSGSRNWMILKFVFGGSLFFRFLLCFSLCTAASLPPVIQFFVEVSVLFDVGLFSLVLFLIFCVYLFFSSLVPLFFVGVLLSRHFCVSYNASGSSINFSFCVIFLLIWSFILFLVI
uniref:NADH-ubiquinone oxidoreductase chain 4 n=1 Tax=Hysteromorpha triloba TaxID=234889 RepID=A0A6J3YMG1_9TREM|nr:NADH dehydrogenase subunit 4 [Hysteromorpha triloba]